MERDFSTEDVEQSLDQILGYLNFSSGGSDVKVSRALNKLASNYQARVDSETPSPSKTAIGKLAEGLRADLTSRLESISRTSAAFQNPQQARDALSIVFDDVLPGYFRHHADLLWHQMPDIAVNSFFIARVFEATLKVLSQETPREQITREVLRHLNDFVGHRPIATLESHKGDVYANERVRPVPIFIRDAGAAFGPYQEVVERAIQLIANAPDEIVTAAGFDLQLLDELAFDPRAYDFDHPANKRPNYQFGIWDPHLLDQQGRFRRFVSQQITLDALLSRVTTDSKLPREELLFEAAAVLAGTILMASGISGGSPSAHDSTVTLGTLLPGIARYRDAFYSHLIESLDGPHGKRLKKEAKERKQPFGGARQHLNAELARLRATQLEHAHLSRAMARMGLPDSAAKYANVIPCASVRIMCRIDCLLTEANQLVHQDRPDRAVTLLMEAESWMHRGIRCGALIDPWNVLGFDGAYPLFHGPENSVHDYRADDLIEIVESIFASYAKTWNRAIAQKDEATIEAASHRFGTLAHWWHQYAVHEVSAVDAVDPLNAFSAADRVAEALRLWHAKDPSEIGAARGGGNVKFWARYAEMFDGPKAYALVVEALFEQDDLAAAMALLVHWISRADQVPLVRPDASFHDLCRRWFDKARTNPGALAHATKFLDYLEANAETLWRVPEFAGQKKQPRTDARDFDKTTEDVRDSGFHGDGEDRDVDEGDEEDGDPFSAAYDEIIYRDSTDDGVEGPIAGERDGDTDELSREAKRLGNHLDFHSTLAILWRSTALLFAASDDDASADNPHSAEKLRHWIETAEINHGHLLSLLSDVEAWRLPNPSGNQDSMLDYYRAQSAKEHLLEKIASTCVDVSDASRLLRGAYGLFQLPQGDPAADRDVAELDLYTPLYSALFRRDAEGLRRMWGPFLEELAQRPLLYVPLAKHGKPANVVRVRSRQHAIEDLLSWMPKLGLILETCQLMEAARDMERRHKVGSGAVTEFDELFKVGYRSIVEALVTSSRTWHQDEADDALISCMEQMTESLLATWLAHSRTLRLSALEKAMDRKTWKRLVDFIQRFGGELFTQRFLNLGTIRAILHQGVSAWLGKLREEPTDDAPVEFLAAFDDESIPEHAVEDFSLILESIAENFIEFRDYNTTTTQSDKGEMLFSLLDFLRLRTKYDRVCWNLKPVMLSHEILLRHGCDDAARVWQRALNERISDEADGYLRQLAQLQKKYAMRMPTVADRLGERFVRPLSVDRVRALVKRVMEEARSEKLGDFFELFESEIQELTKTPTGVGLDVPTWIAAIEDEVESQLRGVHDRTWEEEIQVAVPTQPMTLEQAQSQLDAWSTRK
jgi:hypothetical protein